MSSIQCRGRSNFLSCFMRPKPEQSPAVRTIVARVLLSKKRGSFICYDNISCWLVFLCSKTHRTIFLLLVLVTFSAQHLRPWNSFETRCAGLEWCDDSWQWNQDLPGNPTLNLDTKCRSYRTLSGSSLLLPIENRKLKHVTFLSQGRQAEVSCVPLIFTPPHLYY